MLYVIMGILALILGSFLNVVIYRLPKMIEAEIKYDCAILLHQTPPPPLTLNLWLPRSFCSHCKNTIPFYANIPLVSYFIQKGKCLSCGAAISMQYPLIEAMTLLLVLFITAHFGLGITLLFSTIYIAFIIPLFVIDTQHQLLPDVLTLSLLWLGLIANTQGVFCTLQDAVFGAAIAYTLLWLVMKIFYIITGKQGMGHGDFKLFAALGAWFGVFMLPFILLFSSILGVICGLLYLYITKQSRHTPIPFGPFLCMAGFFSLFYGKTILSWYFI